MAYTRHNGIFDKIAWFYNPMSTLFRDSSKYYSEIRSAVGPRKLDVVLDAGGGTGLIAQHFLSDAGRVVVLDPSEKMLERVFSDRIEKVRGCVQQMGFSDNTFDLIYCVDSFHHFTNGYSEAEHDKATDLSIRELLRTLKKDGVLVIMEFNAGKFGGKMIELLENKLFGMGSRFYHDSEFKTLFNKYSVNVAISSLDGSAFLARITK